MKKFIIIILVVVSLVWFVVFRSWPKKKVNIQDKNIETTTWSTAEDTASGSDTWSGSDTASGSADKVVDVSAILDSWNIEWCKQLKWIEAENCADSIYYEKWTANNSADDCNKITNPLRKKQCLVIVSSALVSSATTEEDCKKIADPIKSKECSLKLKVSSSKWVSNISECTSTDKVLELWCKDTFYFNQIVGWISKDINTCNNISNTRLKADCIDFYNKSSNANKLSSQASDALKKWDVVTASKLTCQAQTSWGGVDLCLARELTAQWAKTWDVTVCDSIKDAKSAAYCKTNVWVANARNIFDEAMKAKDPSKCAEISDAKYAAQCKKIVSAKK